MNRIKLSSFYFIYNKVPLANPKGLIWFCCIDYFSSCFFEVLLGEMEERGLFLTAFLS